MALNASGGTRLMGLAALEVFRSLDCPVFYVDPHHDRLSGVYPPGTTEVQLNRRVPISTLLQCAGVQMPECGAPPIPAKYRYFATELLSNIRHYGEALGMLDWSASTAVGSLQSRPLESWHLAARPFIELLDRLRELDLARVVNRQRQFYDETARYFANGGWLQQYVVASVEALRERLPAIQDVAQGLQLVTDQGVRHQADVAVLMDNRLHLIECRPKLLRKGNAGSGAQTLYKLDTLAPLLDTLSARGMLLSYRPLRDVDVRRAGELGLVVVQERQLQNLEGYLEQWLRAAESHNTLIRS
ncbi:MAG: DUF1887 family CARF protein [Thiolinea sp.]